MIPYLPLPTKLRTTFLPAVRPEPGEDAERFAARIHVSMQTELDRQTAGRTPILG